MRTPDVFFNPSAGARHDNSGDYSTHAGYLGIKPDTNNGELELNLKELRITNPTHSDAARETYLVTLSIDNQAPDPIRLRIVSLGKVRANQPIDLPSDGLRVYRQAPKGAPSYMDYRMLIIESLPDVPDLPTLYHRILQSAKYISVRDILCNVVRFTPPTSSLIAGIADIVLNLTVDTINANESAQLLYVRGNFDRKVDEMGVRYGLLSHGNDYASVKYQVERKL